MALILRHCFFIHIPKTGGTWVTAALQNADLIVKMTGKGTLHASLREVRHKIEVDKLGKKKVFGFVRNPLAWWQSRWSCPHHRKHYVEKWQPETTNWCGNIKWMNYETLIKTDEQFNDFNTYIQAVLERRPGFFSEYLRFMTNHPGMEIGKHENLAKDLTKILYRCGENFDLEKIEKTPKVNESDAQLDRRYTPENLKKVIEAEKEILDKYGYSTRIDDYQHLLL